MEKVSTIVCPNCGANASNFHNCEYCGSLLVRFIDKNIPLDAEKYSKHAVKFDGLKGALAKNLEEQARTDGRNHIHTYISLTKGTRRIELDVTNPKSQTESIPYTLSNGLTVRIKPVDIPSTQSQSLVICFRFYEITEKIYLPATIKKEMKWQDELHKRFKRLDMFPLFTLHADTFANMVGRKMGTVYQYYLDFGQDIDGAASIITQLLLQGFDVSKSDMSNLNYRQTSFTDEEYEKMARKSMRGSKSWGIYGKIVGWLLIIGGAVLLFFILSLIGYSDSTGESIGLIMMPLGIIALGIWILYSYRKKMNY